jgi:antitoxin (DNA-binding transcriptional repressor) of toxin-antitoxin stability system
MRAAAAEPAPRQLQLPALKRCPSLSISAKQKARLSELVAKVEAGEEVVIARGNEPIAKLSALGDEKRRRAAIEAMLRERDDGTRKKVTIEEILAWRHEGHHF